MRIAFSNLSGLALTANDWKVFGYLIGRGALWVAVITAIWSMYDYFTYFFRAKQKSAGESSTAETRSENEEARK